LAHPDGKRAEDVEAAAVRRGRVSPVHLPESTRSDLAYWTSDTDPLDPIIGITVSFSVTGQTSKTRFAAFNELLYFRAVRGGS
jgi:hypothetical protein